MAKLELPLGSGIPLTKTLDVLDARPPLSEDPGTSSHTLFIAGEQPGIGGAYYTSSVTGRRETVAKLTLRRGKDGKVVRFTSDPNGAGIEHKWILRGQEGREKHP